MNPVDIALLIMLVVGTGTVFYCIGWSNGYDKAEDEAWWEKYGGQ